MSKSWLAIYSMIMVALTYSTMVRASAHFIKTMNDNEIAFSNKQYKAIFTKDNITFAYIDHSLNWSWKLADNDENTLLPSIEHSDETIKIIYERELFDEIYLLKPHTIEQVFVIKKPPVRLRDFVINGQISSNGRMDRSQDCWIWKNENRKIALGQVFSFDAAGNKIPTEMMVNQHSNQIFIDKEFLQDAVYPITIDPEIGDEVVVVSNAPHETKPVSVYNSVDKEVLTIWAGPKATCSSNIELKGQKINPVDGSRLGNAFSIYEITANCEATTVEIPEIAYDPARNQYFVILKTINSSSKKVIGFLINANGEKVSADVEFASTTFGDPYNDLLAKYDPANDVFLAGYHVQIGASEMALHIQEINTQTGQKEGTELVIDKNDIPFTSNTGPKKSKLIFNETSNKFFAVFHADNTTTSEVWGTSIDGADISSLGSFFQVSPDGTAADRYKNPSITYNKTDNEFLVVYEDVDLIAADYEQVANIYGQRIAVSNGSKLTNGHVLISKIPLDGCGGCIEQAKLPSALFSPVKNEYLVSFYGAPTSSGNEIYGIYGSRLVPNDLIVVGGESIPLLQDVGTSVIENNNLIAHSVLYFQETDKFLFTWINQQSNEVAVQLRKYENHAPTELNLSGNSIDENQPVNTLIGRFSTTDLDDDDAFTYSLTAGDDDDDNSLFSINNDELRSNAIFNFENKNEMSIRIRSTDSFGESAERSFSVSVNDVDESPTDIEIDNLAIQEFQPEGTLVGNLTALDPDANSTLSYQIVTGTELFQVESDQLKTKVVFDYTQTQSVPVTIKVVDNSDLEFSKEFTIEVEEYPDFTPPVINQENFKDIYIYNHASEEVGITATDDKSISQVLFYFRKITDDEWTPFEVDSENDDYIVSITKDLMGEIGMKYFFEVNDLKHKVYSDTTIMTYSYQDGDLNITGLDFGGKEEDYQIISIPYSLDNSSIAAIFEDDLGKQSPASWRLLHYDKGACCKEYPGSLNSIERGRGYWFNQREKHDITLGSGHVEYNPKAEYFEIELQPGWNQIGNPFPFTINWADVVEYDPNGDLFNTGKVSNNLFQYENGDFAKDGMLAAFKGAFVSAEENVTVKIPLRSTSNSNGRKAGDKLLNPIDQEAWEVPLVLKNETHSFTLGAIGMHPEADPSKDKFDELLIPGFGNYLEYSFRHPEYFYQNFARDIVPTQQNYVWTFTAASANSGYDVLSWNNDFFGDNRMNLFLIDFSSGMITDMRKKDNYGFYLSRNREFKILYGTDEFISLQLQGIQLVSGTPYPNPFNGQLYIPLILPSSTAGYDVDLEIFNATGKLVFSQTYKSITDNLNTLTWKGENNNGEHTDTGIYIYKVIVSNTGNTFTGKVVKK